MVDGRRKPPPIIPAQGHYAARPDVGAVVHTQSVYATAMAAARADIPGIVEDLVQIVGGYRPRRPLALPGTEGVGAQRRGGAGGAQRRAAGQPRRPWAQRPPAQALTVCQIIEKSAHITHSRRRSGRRSRAPPGRH